MLGFMLLLWLGKVSTSYARHIYPQFVYKLLDWLAPVPLNDHVFRCDRVEHQGAKDTECTLYPSCGCC